VTALDQWGNTKTDYVGTITFATDAGASALPANYAFTSPGDNGVHTFTSGVNLRSIGSFYVSVTDTVVGTATGSQIAIDVTPGVVDSFTVTSITDPTTTDNLESPIVTALDQWGNTKTDYVGTITFATDAGASALPANYTFTSPGDNGVHTFTNSVNLRSVGSFYVSVTDTVVGTATGSQTAIDVAPGVIDSFTVTSITDPTTPDNLPSPIVTALDQWGNTKTDYVGTITFATDAGISALPANYTFTSPGDNGVHTFTNGVNLRVPGVFYVNVTL
jgi:hypothetical protein